MTCLTSIAIVISLASVEHMDKSAFRSTVFEIRGGASSGLPSGLLPTVPFGSHDQQPTRRHLLTVGSVNVDITIEVERLPKKEETVVASSPRTSIAVGGKGANQAAAVARLAVGTSTTSVFVCQFGNDGYAEMLHAALNEVGVDTRRCLRSTDLPSGQGIVMLTPDGAASSIVVAGSNSRWHDEAALALAEAVRGASAVLLQREIPESVNLEVARAAKASGVCVLLDIGGEASELSGELLSLVDYICPNESELERLTGMRVATRADALAAASTLQSRGCRSVLVTLGDEGAILLQPGSPPLYQPALPVPGGRVVDGTGAGDSFRAAFALALTEGLAPPDALRFAAAAGAWAVSVRGALPSLPSRDQCEIVLRACAGECVGSELTLPPPPLETPSFGLRGGKGSDEPFSLQFASRLNSMKDGAWRYDGDESKGVLGWVARQGSVRGLDMVDFNYPQHLSALSHEEVRAALKSAGLRAGAICMRYPKSMQAGAFTNADPTLRRQAIELTKEACGWAVALGAEELVVWSAFDGYDYPFQADYTIMWSRVVEAFQEVCDAFPQLKVSLEFKPTDENTRFFAVPSTGSALLLVNEIDRPNMGLTLDFGHCLAAGENPAQSVAMVGSRGKLFGIQLNDGYTRIGAEDGLIFGSVHKLMALETVRWLQRTDFRGHIYFDTFPRNEDPVRECEYNIRKFKQLWLQAVALEEAGMGQLTARQDAMGVLELLELAGL